MRLRDAVTAGTALVLVLQQGGAEREHSGSLLLVTLRGSLPMMGCPLPTLRSENVLPILIRAG